ncbi:MAG: DegT/DnrJ/EryC1/StrS family aminotransferase [Bacteroidia bacterium]|nr:DegT/DnrJ/EryC1/StrS family aminotransferase [Bacteroidia bacterium]
MHQPIPVNTPLLGGNELKYLTECIETGWISSEGPFIKKFEEQMAVYVGRKHGIAVSNGSAALDVAIKALNLKKGDEVIMPTFTIISPAQSLINVGAIPVLVDSDASTWNMDVNQIEAKITSKTKAILVVHIYGLPVDMLPVLELCKKYNLLLIEDAAEMHGQTYNGQQCGSFGDISIFSFYPNKHITSGEGGMIMCNDDALAERCRKLRNLAFETNGRRFIHYELGWNYRMTNMQAAIGLAQLEKLDIHIAKKRKIGKLYDEGLKDLKGFQLPLPQTNYAENIYWVYAMVAETEDLANKTVQKLNEGKIGTRPFFWCMHEQPVFQKMGLFKNEHYPVAEKIARNGFYIPSGLGLSEREIDRVIDVFKNIVG